MTGDFGFRIGEPVVGYDTHSYPSRSAEVIGVVKLVRDATQVNLYRRQIPWRIELCHKDARQPKMIVVDSLTYLRFLEAAKHLVLILVFGPPSRLNQLAAAQITSLSPS